VAAGGTAVATLFRFLEQLTMIQWMEL